MTHTPIPLILWEDVRVQADNNCACSAAEWSQTPIATSLPQVDNWQQPAQLYSAPLPHDYTLLFSPFSAVGPVVLNAAARAQLGDFGQPLLLTNPTVQQLAQWGFLHPVDAPPQVQADATTLTAWLHVTNACNLRCVYCYVNKSDEAMNEATGQAAIDAIFRSAVNHGFRRVQLKYAGGEATLNFALVQTLHAYAQAQATATGMGLEAVVLSNGIALTNAMLDYLQEAQIRLMISLDGSEEEHNRQRVFVNGRGSYTQVARSVDRALARGVKPHLSITVTGRSVDGVAKAVSFALERDLLFNLNFYRDHAPHKSQRELRAEDEQLIAAMRAAFAVIETHLPRQSLIGALVDRASFAGPHQRSCGAGHNYLVIDQKGSVARCQMEIEQPITHVLAPDPLTNIRLYDAGFQNLSVDEKEGCRDCAWRYWCGGGCSLLTYRVTGRNDVKSPYCHVYKTLYPEMLRLEGLRLLKWQAGLAAHPQPTVRLQ